MDINPHISDSLDSGYAPSGQLNLLVDDSSVDSLDIDGNGEYDALTDGLLLLRGMFGLTGSALVSNAVATDANYTGAVDIQTRIESLSDIVDIDANGQVDALTDGLIILRYLFGLRGDVLLSNVVSNDADRDTALAIEAYVESLLPEIEDNSDLETIYVRLNDQPFTAPYYLFSATENGAAQTVTLEKGASYKFVRTDSGHPFNIGSGWRESLPDLEMSSTSSTNLVSDLGSIEDGQSLTLTIPSDFAATTITYYCYTHFSMKATLAISHNTAHDAPVFNSSALFSALENQTSIGSVSATDGDSTSIIFSISEGDLEITSAGLLSFKVAPDYEAKGTYTATVTASDGTNETSQSITVSVTDMDDEAPVFTSPVLFNVAENQTAIGTVAATDADSGNGLIRFTVSGSDLEINTISGALGFKVAPDYETKSSYAATVTASDGTNSVTQLVSVSITDVDDVAPEFTSLGTFSALENQTSIGSVSATDGDSTSIIFSISEGDLEITSAGLLSFKVAPDYEAKGTYTATVTASDGTNETSQSITVSVTDMDDEAPVFTSPVLFNVAENQTAIGTVAATDADSGNGLIRFTVSGSDLEINTISGALGFKVAPDYETKSSYAATVTASDGTNSATQALTVNITDIVEYTPPVNTSGAFELLSNTVTLEDYNPASQTTITNQFVLDFVDGVASADLRSAPLNLTNIKNGTTSPVGDYSDTLLRFDLNNLLPLGNGTGTVDLYVTTGSDGIRANSESQLHCQLQITWSSDGIDASILEPSQDISLKVNRTGLMISTTINEFDIMTISADELTGVKTLDIKLLSALSEGVRVAGGLLNSLLIPRTLHIKVATTLLINDSDGAVVSEFDSIISLAN